MTTNTPPVSSTNQNPGALFTPPPPKHPATSLAGRMWSGAKASAQAAGSVIYTGAKAGVQGTGSVLYTGAKYLTETTTAPFVDGLTNNVTNSAKNKFQTIAPQMAPQVEQAFTQALLRQPPSELLQLKQLIKKALEAPNTLTFDEVQAIHDQLKLLIKDSRIVPHLNAEKTNLFQKIIGLFEGILTTEYSATELELYTAAIEDLSQTHKTDVENFDTLLDTLIEDNRGALIKAMTFTTTFLQDALLADQHGMLSGAVDLLKGKLADENKGLIKEVVDQLTRLLDKKDGPIDVLSYRLNDEETGIITKALEKLNAKLQGTVADIGKQFNDETDGIIPKALAIAKAKFDAALIEGLATLKAELTSETG